MAEEMKKPAAPAEEHHHHHHHHHEKGHQCRCSSFAPDSLTGLAFKLAHQMRHCEDSKLQNEQLFAALDPQEKQEFKEILEKLVASWNTETKSE